MTAQSQHTPTGDPKAVALFAGQDTSDSHGILPGALPTRSTGRDTFRTPRHCHDRRK